MKPKNSLKTSVSDGRDNLRKQIGLNCRAMKTALPNSTTFLYLPVKIVSFVKSSKERKRPYEGYEERKNLKNCIHHTDADDRYCSDLFTENLIGSEVKISMCVGNVYENAFLIILNKTVKAGEINISDYETIEEAASSNLKFINTYNSIRPHSSLNGM